MRIDAYGNFFVTLNYSTMKKISILAALIAAMTFAIGCSRFSNRGTVDKPFIAAANQNNFYIDKVELTDSNTVLHGLIRYPSGYWVRLSGTSVIEALGESYPLISADGIALDEQVTMPDSGAVRFTMTYPAIPAEAQSIDFSENTDKGWRIWGIDLTGNAPHDINKDQVPSSLRDDRKRPMPEMQMAWGDTATVNVHLLGYRPSMGDKMTWVVNTIHGQTGADAPVAIDAEGNAVVRLPLSVPAEFICITTSDNVLLSGSAIVSPGENVELYVDTHISGIYNMNGRDRVDDFNTDGYRNSFVDGRYPNVGNVYGGMSFYTGKFGDYHMNGDAYTDYIIEQYETIAKSMDSIPDMTPAERDYARIQLKGDLAKAAVNAASILARNYYHVHGWDAVLPSDSISVDLSVENIKKIAERIDFNDVNLLLADDVKSLSNIALWEKAGIDAGILKTVGLYNRAYKEADNARLDTATVDELRTLCRPMAEEIEAHCAAVRAKLAALDASRLSPTPDVAPDGVFDAIVAPHKGKVVMVDLWNTWCGPCRAALAANEPAKSGDLSSDDIVWIYIANESSPEATYMTMIQDIKGLHYRLTPEQWDAVCNRFNVDGIPYYILVTRDGKATGRPDLRDHDAYRKAILEAL